MRSINKMQKCVKVIVLTAIVAMTTLSGTITKKVEANAGEVTDKPPYYWEDDSTFNKDNVKYVMDKQDSAAFYEYFGYFNNEENRQMNIFYEDSTLRIDADKSAYSFDDVNYVMARAYQLSRDDEGKLTFSPKTIFLNGNDAIGGNEFSGIGFDNFLIKKVSSTENKKAFSKMTFSKLYNSKSTDGRFQTEGYKEVSNGSGANGAVKELCDIDFLYIAINYKVSEDKSINSSIILMPDYMIDKTVLNLKKVDSETETKPAEDTTYTFDISENDTQIVDDTTYINLLKENETKSVVIKSNNNVTFTFEKGTMQNIGGKEKYDFSTTINSIYSDTMPSYVTKENFISQINFNYSGELPAIAYIRIPVGTQYAGKTLYYSYMNNDNTFADTQTVVVDEEGYITVKQNHCSSYVVTNKAPEYISAGSKDTEQDTQITESNTENVSTDTSAPADENVDTPQTSDNNNVYIYVACIILALTGVIKYGKMKKVY